MNPPEGKPGATTRQSPQLFASFEEFCKRYSASSQARIRPSVTVSYAQSLDGCLNQTDGVRTIISGFESTQMTHRLRSAHDAILIGRKTLNVDNPQLTVRHWNGPSPQPIILSCSLALDRDAQIFQRKDVRPWVATTANGSSSKLPPCDFIRCHADGSAKLNLRDLLSKIYKRGIRHLMVEGGAGVIESFIEAELVDYMVVTVSPTLLGESSSTRIYPTRPFTISEKGQEICGQGRRTLGATKIRRDTRTRHHR